MKTNMHKAISVIFFLSTLSLVRGEEISIGQITAEIRKDNQFDISPRYIVFRPSETLKKKIDAYVADIDAAKILEIEEQLWKEDSSLTAIALIQILGSKKSANGRAVIARYRRFILGYKPNWKEYPTNKEVAAAVSAYDSEEDRKNEK